MRREFKSRFTEDEVGVEFVYAVGCVQNQDVMAIVVNTLAKHVIKVPYGSHAISILARRCLTALQ